MTTAVKPRSTTGLVRDLREHFNFVLGTRAGFKLRSRWFREDLRELERRARMGDQLLAIHKGLFPERYKRTEFDTQWDAGTIEHVAAMIERALKDDPRARLEP